MAVTSAGELGAKYVFHAVTIDRDRSLGATEESLRTATTHCLSLADSLSMRTIALPALGAGSAGVPTGIAADVMTTTICDYLRRETRLERVILALFARPGLSSESDFEVFYERAAAISAIASQSRALAELLSELRVALQDQHRSDLVDQVRRLESELTTAQHELADQVVAADFRALGGVGRRASQLVERTESSTWNDRQLEAEVVRTRLAGLLTQQNVIAANLNQLEIQQANFGSMMVPPILVNSIAEQRRDYDDIDQQVKGLRMRLANLIGS